MNKTTYKITISGDNEDHQIPIFLDNNADEMGVMVGWDGNVGQVDEVCNFTYTTTGTNTITIYNTVDTNKLKTLIDAVFTVSWGDGMPDQSVSMPNGDVPSISHTYAVDGDFEVKITIVTPWKTSTTAKTIKVPFETITYPTTFGKMTFTVPYTDTIITQTQEYLMNYRSVTGSTVGNDIGFIAIGKSRLSEFKKYGVTNVYEDIDITSEYTGYTIDNLYYMDYTDGYTYITGNTSDYYDEVVYDGMITRDEHLIGFVDQTQIQSDVFVERGRMGVMERNLRLCEVDGADELIRYGGGFFDIKKQ